VLEQRVTLWIGAAGTKCKFSSIQGPGEPALLLNFSSCRQRNLHHPKVPVIGEGTGESLLRLAWACCTSPPAVGSHTFPTLSEYVTGSGLALKSLSYHMPPSPGARVPKEEGGRDFCAPGKDKQFINNSSGPLFIRIKVSLQVRAWQLEFSLLH